MTTASRVQQTPDPRRVEVYDFRRPTTLVREHVRILEQAFETFARQWGTLLTAKVRVVSQVTLDAVVMKTYDNYVADLPTATTVVVCELEGYTPRAVIQFPHTDALTWIAHMLGSGGPIPEVDRKFTDVERALVTALMEETIRDLRHSLGRLLENRVQIISIQHNSQFAQAAPTAELMIVATFDLRIGERACRATIALPSVAMLHNLGEASPADNPADANVRVRQHVSRAQLDVRVRLLDAALKPSDVLALQEGDVIRLPHHETRPLDVITDGHLLARGALGQSGSRLACKIITTEEN